MFGSTLVPCQNLHGFKTPLVCTFTYSISIILFAWTAVCLSREHLSLSRAPKRAAKISGLIIGNIAACASKPQTVLDFGDNAWRSWAKITRIG